MFIFSELHVLYQIRPKNDNSQKSLQNFLDINTAQKDSPRSEGYLWLTSYFLNYLPEYPLKIFMPFIITAFSSYLVSNFISH